MSDTSISRDRAAADKSAPGFWDNLPRWYKRISLLAPVVATSVLIIYAFVLDWNDKNTLYIEPVFVLPSLASGDFPPDIAAQALLHGIEDIQNQAQAATSVSHPALAQPDAVDAEFPDVELPGTGLTFLHLRAILRALIPTLQRPEVTASYYGSPAKPGLHVRLSGRGINPPLDITPLDAKTTAQDLIYKPDDAHSAAFKIVQAIDPYIAISALNSWGDNADAGAALSRYIDGLQPNAAILPQAYNLLGFIDIEQDDDTDAVQELRHAGNFGLAHANLCYIYQDTRYVPGYNLTTAENECDLAIASTPSLPSPYLHLGVIYKLWADAQAAQNHTAAAQAYFNKARWDDNAVLKVNAGNVSADTGLGDIFADPAFAGYNPSCAITAYRKAVELDPNYSIARLGLANAYTGEGDWSKAADSYRTTLTGRQAQSGNPAIPGDPSLGMIADFIPLVNEIAKNPDPAQREILRGQSVAALAKNLTQALAQSPTNRTLADKISTEMEILKLPMTPVPQDCS